MTVKIFAYRYFIVSLLLCFSLFARAAQDLHASHAHQPHTNAACKDHLQAAAQACAQTVNGFFDHNGRLWLVWAQHDHVYVQHSDDRGRHYSTPVKVNKIPEAVAARGENRPKILVDSEGRVFVSWTIKLAKRFSGHIRFSRSVNAGRDFSAPITVNDHLAITSHRFETMNVNSQGEIFIAWLDKRDLLAAKQAGKKYTGAAVYYSYSDDHGRSFHANIKLADGSCQCCRIAMSMDNDELPVILWRHIFAENIRDHALLKLQGRDQPGELRRASFEQWQMDACPHHGPSISVAENGSYHLAWFSNAKDAAGLFYAYSSDQGKTFSKALNFGLATEQAAHPQVLALKNRVYLLWKIFDGRHSQLMLMQSRDNGVSWSVKRRLQSTDGATGYPQLLNNADNVYAAWHRPGHAFQLIPIKE